MSDATPTLESYEEGGSITATKMRKVADSIEVPAQGDRLLTPARKELTD